MKSTQILSLFAVVTLSSCSMLKSGNGVAAQPPAANQPLNHLPPVRTNVTVDQLTPEEDIVWTDSDSEEAADQLATIWSKPVEDIWRTSHRKAVRESQVSGKPLLIWFTNSGRNAICAVQSREVFSAKEFNDWAKEKVVRLRVDTNVQEVDENARVRERNKVETLRKRYKVLGSPVVIMLSPSGEVVATYRGYQSGNAEHYFGRLKNGHRAAMSGYAAWRESMEKKGYRVWHDLRGRAVFAKPTALKGGRITLVNPDGKKSRLPVNKLSPMDRSWIAKKKREWESR